MKRFLFVVFITLSGYATAKSTGFTDGSPIVWLMALAFVLFTLSAIYSGITEKDMEKKKMALGASEAGIILIAIFAGFIILGSFING
jgi:FtsH-binding integral membrane protein